MCQNEEEWQLFEPAVHPCFPLVRKIQFLVVLSTPQYKVPTAVMPGTVVGRRVKANVFRCTSLAVKARYGACIITGAPH